MLYAIKFKKQKDLTASALTKRNLEQSGLGESRLLSILLTNDNPVYSEIKRGQCHKGYALQNTWSLRAARPIRNGALLT
jgi:hypothetical protein